MTELRPEKLAERYVKYGDPRRKNIGDRPTSQEAHEHAAKVAREIERQEADKK